MDWQSFIERPGKLYILKYIIRYGEQRGRRWIGKYIHLPQCIRHNNAYTMRKSSMDNLINKISALSNEMRTSIEESILFSTSYHCTSNFNQDS